MIKNNKGVTLVELLIVIVVMGIIAAFAIPAVGTIIENTNQDAVVADALAIENAGRLYCAQTQCATDQALTWTLVEPYVTGLTESEYDLTAASGVVVTYSTANSTWTVSLTGTSGNFSYAGIPSAIGRTGVTPVS